MIGNLRRRRAAARARAQAQDEYRRRVALGEPPLRAAGKLLKAVPPAAPAPPTLVVIEGGRGEPARRRSIWVYGAGEQSS